MVFHHEKLRILHFWTLFLVVSKMERRKEAKMDIPLREYCAAQHTSKASLKFKS